MHKKYTFKDGKRYGPYLYETKRENGKVVTTYLGHSPENVVNPGEKRKRTKTIFYSLLFGVLLLAIVLSFVYFPSFTGKVSLDVKSTYNVGETITGTLKLNLGAGELIPADSNLLVTLGGVSKAFKLSDLVASVDPTDGEFYATDSDISGTGLGYGVPGTKESYPDVSFDLIISGGSDSGTNSNSDNSTDNNNTDQSSNDTSSSDSGSDSGSNTDQSSTSTDTGSGSDSSSSSNSNSDSSSGDSGSSDGGITGAVISDSEHRVSGHVSKGSDFTYTLGDGESASLVDDSVKVNGESIDSGHISLGIDNGKIIVSTDYFTTEEGFGSDYSNGDGKVLQIDLESLGLVAENDSQLSLDLVYQGHNIVSAQKDISVNDVPVENVNVTNETVIANETLNVSVNTTQFEAVLGQPVRWVKTFDAVGLATVSVELPESAENITVRKIAKNGIDQSSNDTSSIGDQSSKSTDENASENNTIVGTDSNFSENNNSQSESESNMTSASDVSALPEAPVDATIDINGQVISGRVTAEIDNKKSGGLFGWLKKAFKFTGLAVTDEANATQEVVVQVSNNDSSVEIEYYTDAPSSYEEDLADRKVVHVTSPADVHYENVLIFTNLSENLSISDPGSVQVFWEENNTYLPVYNISDTNNDRVYDYVEWIAPHLSNQTFDIIVITRAEHLDSNRTFISDIFDSVSALDGNWSEEIGDGDYVRVMFAKNLTPVNDITLYPRTVSGTPSIKIFQKDGTEEVASFDSLNDDQYNRVVLTGLGNAQDTFDLQVLGGSVEFDHIIDPPVSTTLNPAGNASQPTVNGALTEGVFTFSNMSEVLAACYRAINVSGTTQCADTDGSTALDAYLLWNVTLPNYTTVNSIFLTSISGQATTNGTDRLAIALFNFTSGAYKEVNVTVAAPGALGLNVTLTYNITGGLQNNFLSNGIVRFMTRTKGTANTNTDLKVDYMEAVVSYNSRPPIVNLFGPLNNANISNGTVWFSADFDDDLNVTNATLRIWNLTASIGTNFTALGNSSIRGNKSFVLPGEDVYLWNYEAWDSSTNASTNSTNWTLIYDLTRPNVTIINPTNTTYTTFPLIFNLSTSENVTANFTLDGGLNNYTMGANSSGTGYNATNLSLADGTYTFRYYAFDRVGLVNSTGTKVFSVLFNSTLTTCGISLDHTDTTYLLQNDVATTGSCFNITANNVTLNGMGKNIIFGNQSAVPAFNAINSTFVNNTVIMNVTIMRGTAATTASVRNAIYLYQGNSMTLRDISFSNVTSAFIILNLSSSVINNISILDYAGTGLSMTFSNNNNFSNFTIMRGQKGVGIATSSFNTTLTNFIVRNVTGDGIDFGSVNGVFRNVLVSNVTSVGISFDTDTINNTIDNITARSPTNLQAIVFSSAANSTISNITTSRSTLVGVSFTGVNNTITNILDFNSSTGISVASLHNSTLTNLEAYNASGNGISISTSYLNSFFNVRLHDNFDDALSIIAGSLNNTFSNVTIYNNINNGIFMAQASNFTTFNNMTISNTTREAIYLNNTLMTSFNNLTIYNSSLSAVYVDKKSSVLILTNISITRTNVSAYDLNFSDGAYNGTDFNDLIYAANYSFAGAGGTMSIEKNTFGAIVFLAPVNGTGINFSNDIQIGNNSVVVSDINNKGLNVSANVTLYRIPTAGSGYEIRRDGITCPVTVCTNLTLLNAGTVSFNVTGWSNFTIYYNPPDITAPNVTIILPTNTTYGMGTIYFNISTNENATANYTLDSGITNVTMTVNSSNTGFNATNTSLAQGSYTVKYYVQDIAGNKNFTEKRGFTIDLTTPNVTNLVVNPASPTTYSSGASYQFNATVVDGTLSKILLEFNGINYTAHNLTASVYNVTLVNLAGGTYAYRWYANDSLGNANHTENSTYVINTAAGVVALLLNNTAADINVTYPGQVNASASSSLGQSVTLLRDGSDITSSNNAFLNLGVAYYNFTANAAANANYSATSLSRFANVTKGTLTGSIALSPSSTVTYPTATTATSSESNAGDADVIYNLSYGGVFVASPHTTTFIPGTYTYTLNATGGTNWTSNASINTSVLTVNIGVGNVTTYVNHSRANLTVSAGTSIMLNVSLISGDYGLLNLTLDGVQLNVSTTGNLTYNYTFSTPGVFKVTGNYTGTSNYTKYYEEWNVTVPDTVSPLVTTLEPQNSTFATFPIYFNISTNENSTAVYTLDSGITNVTMQVNATGTGFNSTNASLAGGSYTAKYYVQDIAGNKNFTEKRGFTIDLTAPNVTINAPANKTYDNILDIPLVINVSLSENGSAIYSLDGGVSNVSLTSVDENSKFGTRFVGTNSSIANGTYLLSVYANDTVGNNNYSKSVRFTITSAISAVNVSITNSTGGALNVTMLAYTEPLLALVYNSTGPNQYLSLPINTTYHFAIDPLDISAIDRIHFNGVNLTLSANHTNSLFDIDQGTNVGNFTSLFSINVKLSNYTSGNISFVATTDSVFKCGTWNFTLQACTGNWTILMKNLIVGQSYNLTIMPGDPGYGMINITDALHLDENYSFVSNVFSQVSALDDVLSETIPSTHYVRVVFDKPLSSGNDITLYPRIMSGTPNISVFGYGNTTELARFTSLADNQSNQIHLTNLTGTQDTFDLRVLGGDLQFDYIVDPTPFNYLIVQRGDLTTTAVTVNASLSVPINTSSSFVLSSSSTGNSVPTNALMMATITNSTNVQFDRFGTVSHDLAWQVIDGSNFVVQNGTVTSSTGSETMNASLPIAINYSNTFIVFTSNMNSATGLQTIRGMWSARFLNTTMINFSRGATGTASTVSWYAVTFKGATVQNGTLNVTGDPATANLATAVNLSNSFIITSIHTGVTTGATLRVQAYFINSTRIAIFKNTTAGDVEASYFVVSSPAITVQNTSVLLSDGARNVNQTLTALVNTSRTISIASGSYNGSNNNYQNSYFSKQIENSSINSFSRGQAVETVNITSYAISFTSVDGAAPVPLLVSPFNGTIFASNSSTVSFNALFTDDLNVTNATFFLWNSTGSVVNQTVNTSLNGISGSVNFSVTLPYNGTFFWNYRVSDEVGNVVFNSSNYTVTLNPGTAPFSPVTACRALSVPDMIFELQNNIETTGTCLIVDADNITIDGKGKIVYFGNTTGVSTGIPSGVLSINGYNGTIVKNATIRRGLSNVLVGESRRSINFNNTNNVTINYVNTSNSRNGMVFNNVFNVTIANSTSFNNIEAVIISNFTSGTISDLIIVNSSANASIYCTDSCNSTTFNNLTLNSSLYGIYIARGYSNYISNTSISASTTDGIHLLNGSGNTIINYTAFNNSGDSIDFETTQSNTLVNSVINQSAGSAIALGSSGAACSGLYEGNILQNVTIIGTNNSGYDLRYYTASCFNGTQFIDMPHIKNYTFNASGNTIIVNNSRYGVITFLKQVNGSGTNFTNDIRLENNSATVVSSSNNGLNKSANVSLIGLKTSYTGPQIYRDGISCPASVCTNFTSLNAGYVSFNVTGWTNYSIVGSTNIVPTTPTPFINSTKGLNRTAENLNCNSTISDADSNLLNVSVIWYNGSSPALQIDYNNSNASGVNFLAVLRHENTTKGENWSCGMRLFDGTSPSAWANSSSLLILNTPPNSTLSTPLNYSSTTNRRVTLNWATSDDDGDTIQNTTINITCRHASGTSCSVYGADERQVSVGVGVATYAIPSDLVYLADNDYMYNWTVQPTDTQAAQGAFAAPFTFNVTALVSISLPNNSIAFGNIAAHDTNDTSDDSPGPLLVQNDGNSFANVTIFSTDLWGTALNPTSNYQFKAANNTLENGSFTWGLSQVTYLNVPNLSVSTQICIAALNYTNATDTAEVDINVTVPANEEGGYKNSSITFTATLGE